MPEFVLEGPGAFDLVPAINGRVKRVGRVGRVESVKNANRIICHSRCKKKNKDSDFVSNKCSWEHTEATLKRKEAEFLERRLG
jgi:hypothetical protein